MQTLHVSQLWSPQLKRKDLYSQNAQLKTFQSQLQGIPQQMPRRRNSQKKQDDYYYVQHSKKLRLQQQRITEIERSNRILVQKLRGIMLRGGSHRKYSLNNNKNQFQENQNVNFLKPHKNIPLNLPEITNSIISGNGTPLGSQNRFLLPPRPTEFKLNVNLEKALLDSPIFGDSYSKVIVNTRDMLKKQTIRQHYGEVRVGKWKVTGYLLNNAIILRGQNGIRELIKKYPYHKVKQKVQNNYAKWVQNKFDFEI